MENYPLYYEGFNEKGLGICGLNFVGNCAYFPEKNGKNNLAQYELIPYLLTVFVAIVLVISVFRIVAAIAAALVNWRRF